MKTNQFVAAVMLFFIVALSSCKEDDVIVSKPVISNVEVGIYNGKVAYAGADLHLAASIEAAGKIQTIEVEIHKESGTGWKITEVYDEFAGQHNTEFHKHVDIPATAELGEYHVHFIVTDMAGNQTVLEDHLDIQKNADTEGPAITVSSAPTANQQFSKGQTIRISGSLKDNVSLGGFLVALVRSDDSQISNKTVITMDLKYFQDKQEVAFDASIEAGAQFDKQATPLQIKDDNAWRSGDYYILIRTWDATGNIKESQKYPVKVNL